MCLIAIDPYGNEVKVPKKLLPAVLRMENNPAIYDGPERVIQHPALLLTSCNEPQASLTETCENHYFRSIGWENTVLISARKQEGRWTAYRCLSNPSFKLLAQLFRLTKRLCLMLLATQLPANP